ncbi:MAG: PKD domain-containing protein [Desulfobacterales bacterium]|nr:PKD domain-containing protein [Desulfobacterales bacterium]
MYKNKKIFLIAFWLVIAIGSSAYGEYIIDIDTSLVDGCSKSGFSYIEDNRPSKGPDYESWVRASIVDYEGSLKLLVRKANEPSYFRCGAKVYLYADNYKVHTFNIPDMTQCTLKYPDAFDITEGLPVAGSSTTYRLEYVINNATGCDNEGCFVERLTIGNFIVSKPQDYPEYDGYEHNEIRSEASDVFPNLASAPFSMSVFDSYISHSTDVDFFKVRILKPGKLDISLRGLPHDYNMRLYDTLYGGVTDQAFRSGITSENLTYYHTGTNTIDLFIEIFGYNGANDPGIPYELRIDWTPTITPDPNFKVIVTNFSDGAYSATRKVTIQGTAYASQGVNRVDVRQGAGDWFGSWYSASGRESWYRSLDLDIGENIIQVRIKDLYGNYSTEHPILLNRVAPPENVVASDGEYLNKIKVTWKPVCIANYHRVYRGHSNDDPNPQLISSWSTLREFYDETAIPGIDYYYWIQSSLDASSSDKITGLSEFASSGWRRLSSPEVRVWKSSTQGKTVEINWDIVAGGNYYRIYRGKTDNFNEASEITGWRNDLNFTYTDTYNIEEDQYYYYWVISAVNNLGYRVSSLGDWEKVYIPISPPSAPTGFSATTQSNSSILLSWNSVAGATNYDIYTCSGGDVDNTPQTSYQVSNLNPGTYYGYKIRAKNSSGYSNFTSCAGDITYPDLIADFTATQTSVFPGQIITFTDQSAGNPTSWSWNFGDNLNSAQANPTHSYAEVGTYTVSLGVTNAYDSDTETKTGYITVICPDPTAKFSATPTSGNAPLTVNFTDQSLGGQGASIVSRHWNFGDSETGSGVNPSHEYNTADVYTVTLTVSNSCGKQDTESAYITVSEICIKGDVNNDGKITLDDATEAFYLTLETTWTSDELCRADYDEDGVITLDDALEIFWASF